MWLNGELVVDNVALENYLDRKQPIFPVEQLELSSPSSSTNSCRSAKFRWRAVAIVSVRNVWLAM